MSDLLVIGIGNPIMSDDGIGVQAVRYLEGRLPDNVELMEGSVYCADLLPFPENRRKVVFIDGIDAGSEPGTLFRCLLYTSDAADDLLCVDLGGRRIIKK